MARIEDTALTRRILNQIRRGTAPPTAARMCGLSDDAFYDWLHLGRLADAADDDTLYRAFYLDVIAADASFEASMTARLVKAAESDWRATLEVLARRFPRTWSQKTQSRVEIARSEPSRPLPTTELADIDLQKAVEDHYFRRAGLPPGVVHPADATLEAQFRQVDPAPSEPTQPSEAPDDLQ